MEQEIKSHKNTNVPAGLSEGSQGLLGFAVPALAGKFFPWISHGSRRLWLVLKPVGA